MKSILDPIKILGHLAHGSLSPVRLTDPGRTLLMVLSISRDKRNRCREQNFEGYTEIMAPLYDALAKEDPGLSEPFQIQDSVCIPYSDKPNPKERFFQAVYPDNSALLSGQPEWDSYRFVIDGEINRLLEMAHSLANENLSGEKISEEEAAFEFRNLMTDLRYVLSALYRAEESVDRAEKSNGRSGESIKRSGLSNGRSGVPIDDAEKSIDGKIAAGIREILKTELRELQAELEFLDPLPAPSSSYSVPIPGVARTERWYLHQIRKILDSSVKKYNRLKKAGELMELHAVSKQEPDPDSPLLKRTRYHLEIIVWLIVIEMIHTDAVKKGVYTYSSALIALKEADARLYYGETAEEVPETIFSWDSKIEKAERLLGISRLPLIQDRMELLDTMMRQAFLEVKPGTEPVLPEFADHGRVMTAIERLKHDYFTIKQLADHFDITDDAVRSNLRKYKIPTYRFGGQTLVPYPEFAKKMGPK